MRNKNQIWFKFNICERCDCIARVYMSRELFEAAIRRRWKTCKGNIGEAVTLYNKGWIEVWFSRDSICSELLFHELGHAAHRYCRQYPEPPMPCTKEEYRCAILGQMCDAFLGKFGKYFQIDAR